MNDQDVKFLKSVQQQPLTIKEIKNKTKLSLQGTIDVKKRLEKQHFITTEKVGRERFCFISGKGCQLLKILCK